MIYNQNIFFCYVKTIVVKAGMSMVQKDVS